MIAKVINVVLMVVYFVLPLAALLTGSKGLMYAAVAIISLCFASAICMLALVNFLPAALDSYGSGRLLSVEALAILDIVLAAALFISYWYVSASMLLITVMLELEINYQLNLHKSFDTTEDENREADA